MACFSNLYLYKNTVFDSSLQDISDMNSKGFDDTNQPTGSNLFWLNTNFLPLPSRHAWYPLLKSHDSLDTIGTTQDWISQHSGEGFEQCVQDISLRIRCFGWFFFWLRCEPIIITMITSSRTPYTRYYHNTFT